MNRIEFDEKDLDLNNFVQRGTCQVYCNALHCTALHWTALHSTAHLFTIYNPCPQLLGVGLWHLTNQQDIVTLVLFLWSMCFIAVAVGIYTVCIVSKHGLVIMLGLRWVVRHWHKLLLVIALQRLWLQKQSRLRYGVTGQVMSLDGAKTFQISIMLSSALLVRDLEDHSN